MLQHYRTIYQDGTGEYVEKKSRFIANVFSITSEDDAIAKIEQIKKKHYDARHHCFAYSLCGTPAILRFSDDGEPSGTAGKPILEIITTNELFHTLIVVTRYFGGTLLGTGGLVRAYTAAAKEGLANSVIIDKYLGNVFTFKTDYSLLGKIQYLFGMNQISVLDTNYQEDIFFKILLPLDIQNKITKELTEISDGSIITEKQEETYYGKIGEEIILF